MESTINEQLKRLKSAWHSASLVLWALVVVAFISQKFKDTQYTFLAVVVIFTIIPFISGILKKSTNWLQDTIVGIGARAVYAPKIGVLGLDFRVIIHTTFQIILILFLLTLLVQQFNPDLIDKHININYFLIAVLVFGILTILTKKKRYSLERVNEFVDEAEKPTFNFYLFVIFMGAVGTFLIWYKLKTMDIGYAAYLISGLGGILIIYLSILGLDEDTNDN